MMDRGRAITRESFLHAADLALRQALLQREARITLEGQLKRGQLKREQLEKK